MALFPLFLVAIFVGSAEAFWGAPAHFVVGAIAENLLTAQALMAVQSILGGESPIVRESIWADEVRFTEQYSWTFPLHFFNQPDLACSWDAERDCPKNNCVTGAIEDMFEINDSNSVQGRVLNKEEATRFLIHFVQDAMQPMHGGFGSDEGGNLITDVGFNGQTYNLHSLWDTGLITKRVEDDFSNDYDAWRSFLLLQARPPGPPMNPRTYSNDTAKLACDYGYRDATAGNRLVTSGYNISTAYYERAIPIIEQRIVLAGEQLAALFNANLRA